MRIFCAGNGYIIGVIYNSTWYLFAIYFSQERVKFPCGRTLLLNTIFSTVLIILLLGYYSPNPVWDRDGCPGLYVLFSNVDCVPELRFVWRNRLAQFLCMESFPLHILIYCERTSRTCCACLRPPFMYHLPCHLLLMSIVSLEPLVCNYNVQWVVPLVLTPKHVKGPGERTTITEYCRSNSYTELAIYIHRYYSTCSYFGIVVVWRTQIGENATATEEGVIALIVHARNTVG